MTQAAKVLRKFFQFCRKRDGTGKAVAQHYVLSDKTGAMVKHHLLYCL
jgi:predicted metalloprotease